MNPQTIGARTRASEMMVLTFDSQASYQEALRQIESINSDEAKAEWVRQNYPGFYSIYDLYWDAMEEMEEMEDVSQENYENFQKKYQSLYFPMYQDDAGFYIPIRNLNSAFLANENCEISIAGEIVNLKDIEDYGTLVELGRAYYSSEIPMPIAEMGSFNLNSTSMNSVGPEYDSGWKTYGKRKVKLKARRRFVEYSPNASIKGSKSLMHLEFCFRKKTWLGWANYKCKSTIVYKANIPGLGWSKPQTFTHNSRSSHDSELEYPIKITSDASHWYYTFEAAPCEVSINFNDISQTLNYSWTMAGIQCVTPKTSSPVLILPSY